MKGVFWPPSGLLLRSVVYKISKPPFHLSRRLNSSFRAGDRVLLRWTEGRKSRRKLTKPLQLEGTTVANNHEIPHNDIIGKSSNTYFESVAQNGIRRLTVKAQYPSLDEFVTLTPRQTTPIYSSYAASIVDQLDIHVSPPSSANNPSVTGEPTLQILEAGTGHGGLTIHLARAIAGANPTPPSFPFDSNQDQPVIDEWDKWRKQRRAVLHTVDVDKKSSEHANQLIRSFRGGLYWPHIDFHIGDVQHWLAARKSANALSSFLDIVILDMPNVHDAFAAVADLLRPGGKLLVFMPQITQIVACVQEIKDGHLPYRLEQVLEVGDGISTGRTWDVRVTNLKSDRSSEQSEHTPEPGNESPGQEEERLSTMGAQQDKTRPVVCRPMVGIEKTAGGGFIGLWRRNNSREAIA